MAEVELNQRYQEMGETMRYADDVLELLTSEKKLQDARWAEEMAAKVKQKVDKAKETVHRSMEGLGEQKQQIKAEVRTEYCQALQTSTATQPDTSVVREELGRVQKEVREKEKDCQKLQNEQKRLAFHRKHRKIQKRVAHIQFDLSSSSNHVKGSTDLQKPSGELQTFEFDFTEDSPCYVSDFLWDSI